MNFNLTSHWIPFPDAPRDDLPRFIVTLPCKECDGDGHFEIKHSETNYENIICGYCDGTGNESDFEERRDSLADIKADYPAAVEIRAV